MTDEQILALARTPAQQDEGFRWLVQTYQRRLYQVIRHRVDSHADTDDILQNTFIKVFRHLDQFEGRSGLFTWMYRIAQNEISTFYTRQKAIRKIVLPEQGTAEREYSTQAIAEPYVESETVAKTLDQIVSQLPERQQMVFRMRYYDELTYKEMAEVLQLTEGALKASYHHAVKKIEEGIKARF